MGKRIYEMPESLSGLSDSVAGLERTVQAKNKNRSNVRFIYGSGESFPAQSEEIIAGCTPKLINSKIYDNKGHAEILSCYPEKIVNIIKNILHSKQL